MAPYLPEQMSLLLPTCTTTVLNILDLAVRPSIALKMAKDAQVVELQDASKSPNVTVQPSPGFFPDAAEKDGPGKASASLSGRATGRTLESQTRTRV